MNPTDSNLAVEATRRLVPSARLDAPTIEERKQRAARRPVSVRLADARALRRLADRLEACQPTVCARREAAPADVAAGSG